MASYAVIDRCPVPAKLADEIRALKASSGATLNSCYRGTDAEWLLRKYGKMSQRQLWNLYRAGRGNPANPPGFSTHELRSDGVAYRIPRGAPLRYYMVGMDWSNAPVVCAAARRRGWIATVTYPGNPREGHHVNFRKEPFIRKLTSWHRKPLRQGSSGSRVKWVLGILRTINSPKTGRPYLPLDTRHWKTLNADAITAIKKFQKEHGQKADGIVGYHTAHQLGASMRWHKRNRR